jgi:TetR/AcrR family transcriptional regulator, transcriptional repressor for nem operon
MRKSRKEAAETRERIVKMAAREFNESGIQATGLAEIMAAAGLTHGGFYKHFSSKDQLVGEAVEKSMEGIKASMEGPRANQSLGDTVGEYLSKRHRDDSEEACPLASLGSELRRAKNRTRRVASKAVEQIVSIIEAHLSGLSPKEARSLAHAIVAAMVGGMMLSRIVTDRKLSDSFLRDTRDYVLEGTAKRSRARA